MTSLARELIADLWPDGVVPRGQQNALARELGVGDYTIACAALQVRVAAVQRADREPHETPWLSVKERAYGDGVLAAQGYYIVMIEPPPGVTSN